MSFLTPSTQVLGSCPSNEGGLPLFVAHKQSLLHSICPDTLGPNQAVFEELLHEEQRYQVKYGNGY